MITRRSWLVMVATVAASCRNAPATSPLAGAKTVTLTVEGMT
jgi:hypothetical protein